MYGHFTKANLQAMKEYGFKGSEDELKMQSDMEEYGIRTTAELQRVREQDAIKDEMVNESFDDVFSELPEAKGGDLNDGYLWAANHPLVMKAQRHLGDSASKIVVEAKHIRNAPHKWAATLLVAAVNNPKEFRDKMGAIHAQASKKAADDVKSKDDTAPQIDMVSQWLKDNNNLGLEDDFDKY